MMIFRQKNKCDISISGIDIPDDNKDNLVVQAYNLLDRDFNLPRLHVHLYKHIPLQAGLGGGSSDAAYMIRLLNQRFGLGISIDKMRHYAAQLGADCPFFITAEAAYGTGIGEQLVPLTTDVELLKDRYIAIVKPDVAVSTREAFANIKPKHPAKCCRNIICQPMETWKDELKNDFEETIFKIHPTLNDIKNKLYSLGAIYASMSGSGSSLFGLFDNKPEGIDRVFADCFTWTERL